MRRIAIALTAVTLAGAATAGEFEGRAEYQITDSRGQHGTALALVGPGGARFHIEFSMPQAGMPLIKATTLVRADERVHIYAIDDAARSYVVLEGDSAREREWKVTRLGSSSVAGYACERARIESDGSRPAEVCIATTLGRVQFWASSAGGRGDEGMFAALEKAGLGGLPIRWASSEGSGEFVLELVKAHRESVPASTFDVPAGYTRRDGTRSASSSEARARMQDMMKNMSPEQRKRLEQLVQGKGSGD
jgi:hypothetical protein